MDPALTAIDDQAWGMLAQALATNAPLRTLTLATTGQGGVPAARSVILRAVDPAARSLEFHTDIRSAKWGELGTNPAICVLGYDPEARIQLRLQGRAVLHGPDAAENQAAWDALPGWTRHTYAGGPPGDPLDHPDTPAPNTPDTTTGRARFGVIAVQVETLDYVALARGANRRALLRYGPDDTLARADFTAP